MARAEKKQAATNAEIAGLRERAKTTPLLAETKKLILADALNKPVAVPAPRRQVVPEPVAPTPPPTPTDTSPQQVVQHLKKKRLYRHLTAAELIIQKEKELAAVISLATKDDEAQYIALKAEQEKEDAARKAAADARAERDDSSDSDLGSALTIAEQPMECQPATDDIDPVTEHSLLNPPVHVIVSPVDSQ